MAADVPAGHQRFEMLLCSLISEGGQGGGGGWAAAAAAAASLDDDNIQEDGFSA